MVKEKNIKWRDLAFKNLLIKNMIARLRMLKTEQQDLTRRVKNSKYN